MVTAEERDRVEHFETAYNAIKEELARLTGKPEKISLKELVAALGRERKRWRQSEGAQLLELGELRNLLVHDRNEPYEYLMVPTTLAVERIERILGHLRDPLRISRALPNREVVTLAPISSVANAIRMVADYGYSQFPVYHEGKFVGLITTSRFAHWLAVHLTPEGSLTDLNGLTVADVLAEERTSSYDFISPNETVEEVIEQFSARPRLRCLLVTYDGTPAGELRQIVTRYDVAGLLRLLAEQGA